MNEDVPPEGATGVGGELGEGDLEKRSRIQQPRDQSLLATCRFISQSRAPVYVTVDFAFGGFSQKTLYYPGDAWDLHVRSEPPYDTYCWHPTGPCTPNG